MEIMRGDLCENLRELVDEISEVGISIEFD